MNKYKYECNYCDRTFKRERNLALHIREDHGGEDGGEDHDGKDSAWYYALLSWKSRDRDGNDSAQC